MIYTDEYGLLKVIFIICEVLYPQKKLFLNLWICCFYKWMNYQPAKLATTS